jgi:hypothetical protein
MHGIDVYPLIPHRISSLAGGYPYQLRLRSVS